MAFSTIAIAALNGNNADVNPGEYLHLTGQQTTWLGLFI